MAYGNWNGNVYKDGKRRMDKEDVGVWDTDEKDTPKGIRIYANIMKRDPSGSGEVEDSWENHSHHAVLGDGPVRLCGYKTDAELYIMDKRSGITQKIDIWDFNYIKYPDGKKHKNKYGEETDIFSWHHNSTSGEIEIEMDEIWKYKIEYKQGKIELKLIEPDGTIWKGISYYAYDYDGEWIDEMPIGD